MTSLKLALTFSGFFHEALVFFLSGSRFFFGLLRSFGSFDLFLLRIDADLRKRCDELVDILFLDDEWRQETQRVLVGSVDDEASIERSIYHERSFEFIFEDSTDHQT